MCLTNPREEASGLDPEAVHSGQSGLALLGYLAFGLSAHWAYGLGLAVTVQYLGRRRDRQVV